ncbi:MAG TPA: phosphate butyryltransferase, partial [Firmicutes bacterium]|nr:phosphate butyryltransferase [Bacillota bacterium]
AEGIRAAAQKVEFDLDQVEIVHEPNPIQAARKAVELVHNGRAQMLMKGLLN